MAAIKWVETFFFWTVSAYIIGLFVYSSQAVISIRLSPGNYRAVVQMLIYLKYTSFVWVHVDDYKLEEKRDSLQIVRFIHSPMNPTSEPLISTPT